MVPLPNDASNDELLRFIDRWAALLEAEDYEAAFRRPGGDGYLWYDLNIDGRRSDLTAMFTLMRARQGILVRLEDIHVM